ncbi:sigma-70 family RNA polymerase sigma factor [Stieleria mannarensis]|uniref:sigma-70 family RNA polymerase sigma factor n=1 Tax=Stieleria mannarensis TaxID=2755585 RepID=UPI00160487F5|nr:sigma-70 family RNA polymerase sigma factor [Rhodopirellula sp. JC639]
MNRKAPTESIDKSNPGGTCTGAIERFSDAELLDAWTHDRLAAAFAVLVERYSRMVLTVCQRKCRSAADADDAYQTTFLLLAKNSARISRPECLPGWLHRVAHRASIATLTGNHRNAEPMIEPVLIDDPLDRIAQQHDAIVLDEELAGLPEQYRAAVVMQIYDDCSLQRMAEHFQTSLGSIRGRLQRGKKLLADRLRRRGVVPLLAVAAAGSYTAAANEVSAARASLLSSLADGPPPAPPIAENLLHPLVASGKRIMTPWNIVGGLTAAGTVAAMLLSTSIASDSGSPASPTASAPISIAADPDAIVAQFATSAAPADATAGTSSDQTPKPASAIQGSAMPSESLPAVSAGVVTPASRPSSDTQTVLKRRFRAATPTGKLAETLAEMMDQPVDLQIAGTLDSMVDQLQSQLQQPVILHPRVIEYAQLQGDAPLDYSGQSEPLRTALRKLLQPLGLKATIESEGLVITADHSELVHRGIGTDRWLSVDDAMMRQAEEKLAKPIGETFIETPLAEAVSQFSQALDLPIVIDKRSLEDIGIDPDLPVNADLHHLSGYDLIAYLLREHDLALTVKDNLHTVGSAEFAEYHMLSRVYWLEGIGLGGDFDSLMGLIESTIDPDNWESLGGNSTLSPAPGNRPGIVISTTYETHRQIEQLLAALRENSFAPDAIAEEVEVAVPQPPAGLRGFGGGVGFGGGGGGMGGGFM